MNEDIYKEASLKLGVKEKDIKDAYEYYWGFIKETIEKLPLKEMSKEEFESLKKREFNIKRLGSLTLLYRENYRKRKPKAKKHETEES